MVSMRHQSVPQRLLQIGCCVPSMPLHKSVALQQMPAARALQKTSAQPPFETPVADMMPTQVSVAEMMRRIPMAFA